MAKYETFGAHLFIAVFLQDFLGWTGTWPEGESQRRPHSPAE